MEVQIWPGSSSFSTGSTPYGFYDTDAAFASDADKVANWCARRLGYPIVDIELQDINFYTAFEEAVSEYSTQVNQFNIQEHFIYLQGASTGSNLSQREITPNMGRYVTISEMYGSEAGVGGTIAYKTASIAVDAGQQVYNLQTLISDVYESGSAIEIKQVMHFGVPAIIRYFDPLAGTGAGMQSMLDAFGWGGMSPAVSFMMMPVYSDLLRMQAIEFNDLFRKSAYSFELINNEFRIFPIPNFPMRVWFKYIVKSERSNPLQTPTGVVSDISNVPYNRLTYSQINHAGKQWIFKYALVIAKEMLGFVRNKYQSIPFSNNNELQPTDLLSGIAEEKRSLIEELSELLKATGKQAQLEKEASAAQNLQEQFKRVPLKIYIG